MRGRDKGEGQARRSRPDHPSGEVSIRPRFGPLKEGFGTLEDALDSLGEDHVIASIRLDPVPLGTSDRMQQEIFAYFARHHPEELRAASSSSGNLHNPALRLLMPGYRAAVLSTSFVAELKKVLARYEHRVVGVSFEKFSMRTQREPPRFSAITWLVLEKTKGRALSAAEDR